MKRGSGRRALGSARLVEEALRMPPRPSLARPTPPPPPPGSAAPLQDIDRWEGAFISSTSRLVLPLDEVSLPDAEPPLVRSFPRGGLAARVERLVLQEIEGRSEALDS